MKSTGIVRKIDEFGRISLPSELRKLLDLEERAPVEFYVEGNSIIIKKYCPSCTFCGETDKVILYMEKLVCAECIKTLSSMKAH